MLPASAGQRHQEIVMRMQTPRVPPLEDTELSPSADEMLQPMRRNGRVFNIFRTLAHHPDLGRRWLVFANHVLYKSTLPARERELVILRIGWLCRSGYEFNQHVAIGQQAGLTEAEIERIKAGPDDEAWGERDRALLQATDELKTDAFISDGTWTVLSRHYDTQALMDIVFAVGQYNLVSMALNTFGVQLDPGLPQHEV
jgi:alkylhydroperoxidase family enzyme